MANNVCPRLRKLAPSARRRDHNLFWTISVPGSPSDLNTGNRGRNRLPKLVRTIVPSIPYPVFKSEGEPGIGEP